MWDFCLQILLTYFPLDNATFLQLLFVNKLFQGLLIKYKSKFHFTIWIDRYPMIDILGVLECDFITLKAHVSTVYRSTQKTKWNKVVLDFVDILHWSNLSQMTSLTWRRNKNMLIPYLPSLTHLITDQSLLEGQWCNFPRLQYLHCPVLRYNMNSFPYLQHLECNIICWKSFPPSAILTHLITFVGSHDDCTGLSQCHSLTDLTITLPLFSLPYLYIIFGALTKLVRLRRLIFIGTREEHQTISQFLFSHLTQLEYYECKKKE